MSRPLRISWAVWMLAVLALVGITVLKCGVATADTIRFRQHEPMYVSTNYSDSEDYEKDFAPYLKAQASMAAAILREPVRIGALEFEPNLAFTYRAVNWPVGKFSSPIEESNYLPEAWLSFNQAGASRDTVWTRDDLTGQLVPQVVAVEDTDGLFRGGRVGWLHNSTGTDSSSGSIDRVIGEVKFGRTFPIGTKLLYVTGYAMGWYTVSTGAETDGIENYINFSSIEDFGGEVTLIAELPEVIRVVAELGLSYQNFEVYIPLAAAYDLDLFGQLHNGNADGIVDYADRHVAGGVGIALVR